MTEGKSLFEDLIAADEPQLILPDDEDAPPTEEPKDAPSDDERGNNPPATEEESSETSEEETEETDDRAVALYNFLKEQELIEGDTEFSGKPSDLVDILESLPDAMFMRAVDSVHPDAQQLLSYAFELGDKASFEALQKFFANYYEAPVALETDDDAEAYLKNVLKSNKLFNTQDKIDKYLDGLIEKGELLTTAQSIEEERRASREAAAKQATEQAAATRKQAEADAVKFYQTLYDEVQQQPWADTRKNAVLDNLVPQKVNEMNQLIMQSPKAMIQLADIYSRFNPKTKEFDLSDLELKASGKKAEERKEKLAKDRAGSILSGITAKEKPTKGAAQSFWGHLQKIEEEPIS